MQRIKKGFVVIVGLLAISFTIASNANISRGKATISNCYKTITTLNYLSKCSSPITFTTADCSNKFSALGKAVKNDLNVSNFVSSTIECVGTTFICCVNFEGVGTNPCPLAAMTLAKGDGIIKDFTGGAIPSTNWVIIHDIQCRY